MSLQLNKIKKRIKTVSGAYKVTSAMKLISTARLSKYKNRMFSYREYVSKLDEINALVFSNVKNTNIPFLKENEKATKNLYVIVSSTLGLCGAYNTNIFKVAEVSLKEEDDVIILGKKGLSYFKDGKFNKIEEFNDYKNISNDLLVKKMVKFISDKYLAKEYRKIHFIYTEYKNSLTFKAKDSLLLPLKLETKKEDFPPILEPSPEILVESLAPLYVLTSFFSKLLESEVCEQAARRNAMENATDNAKEILSDLEIQFNKARQASITQEITEIVSAANIL